MLLERRAFSCSLFQLDPHLSLPPLPGESKLGKTQPLNFIEKRVFINVRKGNALPNAKAGKRAVW